MSRLAITRTLRIIRYLRLHECGRFKAFAELLAPISRSALSSLLHRLVVEGELTKSGRRYSLRTDSAALGSWPHGIFVLPSAVRARTRPILDRVARETSHSCALFGWVGNSTMTILDEVNQPGWSFNPVGYEWPLVPFHGFALLFLAHAPEALARDCFFRWYPYLVPSLRGKSYSAFRERLEQIRRAGHVIDYREERPEILRIVIPVIFPGETSPCYAVGLAANPIYLIESDRCLSALREASAALAKAMAAHVPRFPHVRQ